MELLIFLIVVLGAGTIAATIFGLVANLRKAPRISTSLAFSLTLFITMKIGLYFFRAIYSVTTLSVAFNSISFIIKYALLSTFIGIILAIISGLIFKIFKLFRFPF